MFTDLAFIAQTLPGTGAADKVSGDLSSAAIVGIVVAIILVGALLLAIPSKVTHRLGGIMVAGGSVFAVLAGGLAHAWVVYLMNLGKAG
jgi:hypothetical protein